MKIRSYSRNLPRDTVLDIGDRPCLACGKLHEHRVLELAGPTSWADPEDGHFYHPESWESLGRKYLAQQAAPKQDGEAETPCAICRSYGHFTQDHPEGYVNPMYDALGPKQAASSDGEDAQATEGTVI